MNKYLISFTIALLIPLTLFAWSKVYAVSHPFEFHADAKMRLDSNGPIEKAYGYMNVITDPSGKGIINVMFSNGSKLNGARFNARVKFLDAAGLVIREEVLDDRIDAADNDGAVERKVTKPLEVTDFDSIKVDFYLSDLPQKNAGVNFDDGHLSTANAFDLLRQ